MGESLLVVENRDMNVQHIKTNIHSRSRSHLWSIWSERFLHGFGKKHNQRRQGDNETLHREFTSNHWGSNQ